MPYKHLQFSHSRICLTGRIQEITDCNTDHTSEPHFPLQRINLQRTQCLGRYSESLHIIAFHSLKTMLLTWGGENQFCPPRKHLAVSGNIFVCQSGKSRITAGIWWGEGRDAAKQSTMYRAVSPIIIRVKMSAVMRLRIPALTCELHMNRGFVKLALCEYPD